MNSTEQTPSPTEALLTWLIPIMAFFLAVRTPVDADMWWHLSAGRAMLAQGRFLTSDTFSFTRAGAPWINVSWLADLGLYQLYRLGGFFALTLISAALISLTMLIILKQCSGPILLKTFIILIGAFGMTPFDGVRPQLLSFLLLALLDLLITLYKNTHKFHPWLLIGIFAFWADIHGGFIWGFLLLGAFICGEILNQLVAGGPSAAWQSLGKYGLWAALAALGTLINPNGFDLWKVPFSVLQASFQNVSEWASPNFHLLEMQPMLWLIFLFIIALGLTKKIPDWVDVIKFCGFAGLAFAYQRSIAPFLVIAIPVVCKYLWLARTDHPDLKFPLPSLSRLSRPVSQKLALAINIGLIAICASASLIWAGQVSRPDLVYADLPVQAMSWVREHKPAGPIFNSFNWGGYLIWALPEYPVFIDGRADLYGNELMSEFGEVLNGSDRGMALLDKWQIKLVFLEPDWPVVKQLPASGWQLLYKDSKTVILGR